MAGERDDARATLAPMTEPSVQSTSGESSARPSRVDRYEIRHELGRGAMGSVFAAWDPKLCREVAIKLVASKHANNEKGRARFLREARAIAAIGQANVVQIFDYSGLDSDALYLVMEKLEGRDLWELMHTQRQFPEAIAALIGHELCLALEAAHQVGIIHRDLKPENVFVTHAGRVVLTDFGIVKAIATDAAVEGFTERTEVIGTPGFMAPELMRGKSLTPMTDVFALGALLYNITTMQMPYEGQSPVALLQAAQKGDYIDPRRFQPSLSSAFCALIKSCLQAQPTQRPQSAEAVRLQLRAILDDLAEHAFSDDVLAWLQDPTGFAEQSHRRAVAHVLDGMTVAVVHGQRDQALALRQRLLALDPFNEAWRPLLAPLLPELAGPDAARKAPPPNPLNDLLVTMPALRVPAPLARPISIGARVAAGLAMLTSLFGVFAIDHLLTAQTPPSAAAEPAERVVPTAAAPLRLDEGPGGPLQVRASLARAHQAAANALEGPANEPRPATATPAPASEAAPLRRVTAAGAPEAQSPVGPPASEALAAAPTSHSGAVGDLHLDVDGEAGAWLILDGHGVGHVHHQLLHLPVGRHRVVLVRRAHDTLRRWVTVSTTAPASWHVPRDEPAGDGAV